MLVEMEERVLVVGRSRTPALDIGACSPPLAAAAIPQARLRDRARPAAGGGAARLPEALAGGVTAAPRARDMMSAPAWFGRPGAASSRRWPSAGAAAPRACR